TARVALPLDRYMSVDQQRTFFRDLTQRLQALPGVSAAGATAAIPLRGGGMMSSVIIEGQPPAEMSMANMPATRVNRGVPGYFAALRVPLIEGRLLDERDGQDAPPSVVVNQAFVKRFFAKEDPIGKRFAAGMGSGGPQSQPQMWTIVGVVGDTKQRGLASDI